MAVLIISLSPARPYPEAEKITFFIYEEIDSCRRACEKLGLGKKDVEKIFYSNSARIFGVEYYR